MRIAILEDDPIQLDLLGHTIKSLGHACVLFQAGELLRRALQRETFDLLILDWHLPDISGPEIVCWVRATLEDRVPILFVTNRQEERDIIDGLACGADDFMIKPIRPGELSARVGALLRRTHAKEQEEYLWGSYRFVPSIRRAELDGRSVALTTKEFDLALFFFKNQGRLLSRAHILDSVWGPSNPAGTELMSRSLDTHISKIRRILELRPENGFRLGPVYGQGYRFEAVPLPLGSASDLGPKGSIDLADLARDGLQNG